MNLTRISTAAVFTVTLAACGGGDGGNSNASSSISTSSSAASSANLELDSVRKLLKTNADIAYAAYSDALATAAELQAAITQFENDPTQAHLDAAKRAWLVAREPYGQTEVYRFRLSPIDSSNYQDEDGPEGAINAWPLGEALIDYVTTGSDFGEGQVGVSEHNTGVNYPTENIINASITIDSNLIRNTATAGDEHDVIAGYHAIEFLLWGQDLNLDGSPNTEESRELSSGGDILDSGGHRPLTDFTTDPNADRRFQYLNVVTTQLIADLTSVRDGWASNADYRNAFTTVNTVTEARQKLAEILTGMGTLSEGELAGERMQIAFSSNSQEDEHSCFSDNTHRDVWLNAEGVNNSYFGSYAGYDSNLDNTDDATANAVDGYGFDDLLTDMGLHDLATGLETALEETATHTTAIDASARAGSPFDVLIMDDNRNADNPIYKAIVALNAQSHVIADVAAALGINADIVDGGASTCNTTNPSEACAE